MTRDEILAEAMKRIRLQPQFVPIITSNCFEKSILSGRGSGKSYAVADAMILKSFYGAVNDVILCAREYQASMGDSVHALLKSRIDHFGMNKLFDVQKTVIVNKSSGVKFLFKGISRNPTSLKSIPNIKRIWFEEAGDVTEVSVQIATNTLRGTLDEGEIIYTWNPNRVSDYIYKRTFEMGVENMLVINTNWRENRYLPETTKALIETSKKSDSDDVYQHIWEGKLANESNTVIIPRSHLTTQKERQETGVVSIGVDVARYGEDRTVFVKRDGYNVVDIVVLEKLDTVQVVDELRRFTTKLPQLTGSIIVDDGGIGGGVVDQLTRLYRDVVAVNFGASAIKHQDYVNTATEIWFNFQSIAEKVYIPKDITNYSELIDELSTRLYHYKSTSTGTKLAVQTKDDYKKQSKRSPDLADALLLAFYTPTTWTSIYD